MFVSQQVYTDLNTGRVFLARVDSFHTVHQQRKSRKVPENGVVIPPTPWREQRDQQRLQKLESVKERRILSNGVCLSFRRDPEDYTNVELTPQRNQRYGNANLKQDFVKHSIDRLARKHSQMSRLERVNPMVLCDD